jgi:Holliday junction DNA helicase RuvB
MAIISSQQPAKRDDHRGEGVGRSRVKKELKSRVGKDNDLSEDIEGEDLLVAAVTSPDEVDREESLRPHTLPEYIGQKDLKAILQIAIEAAKVRREPLDHLLLYGPPGLGKTTMASILAAEMGTNCQITSAPALERPRDITGILVSLKPGDILFIDEIHRLTRMAEELLYPAMEDYRLDITIGKGTTAKTRSLPLPKFTLIGATTRVGSLTAPLRDRFQNIHRLRFYETDELMQIVERSARLLHVNIDAAGAEEIARRSRGTPRIANRLLRRVRDYAQVEKKAIIDREIAAIALDIHDVDPMGLDWIDRAILQATIDQFGGGPVGLDALAAATGEDRHTIEEVYEPYLLQIGYWQRTPRGRKVTAAAREHLGKSSTDFQQSLPLDLVN